MEAPPPRFMFLLFLLTCELAPEVAAEVEKSSDGPGAAQEPTWLADVPAAMEFIAATEVAVIGFFQDLEIPAVSILRSMVQKFPGVSFGISTDSEVLTHYNITGNTICLFRLVDNEQLNLEDEDIAGIDATKLSNFIEINSLHMVTEYNPVILFILVDSGMKENGKVISFFKLKESQLPALAIYRTVDDEWDTLPIVEVSIEHVQNFCDGFLRGKLLVSVRLQVKQVVFFLHPFYFLLKKNPLGSESGEGQMLVNGYHVQLDRRNV
ncbi:endoplasmic reticulum resident protein 27 isoform X3 [Cebus imitator]|uniref:endoplasmic reticulum resident protein 27 isoform X3 n=1 Tax=Cebus imitator TaxID=2715852 RepID=UPI00189BAF22|nr:endoplasmic reticulum resident protein 27 isoform X3 [Cebus imitator]